MTYLLIFVTFGQFRVTFTTNFYESLNEDIQLQIESSTEQLCDWNQIVNLDFINGGRPPDFKIVSEKQNNHSSIKDAKI